MMSRHSARVEVDEATSGAGLSDPDTSAKIGLILQEAQKSHDMEMGRMERLTSKAERYIAATGLIATFHLLELDSAAAGDWPGRAYLFFAIGGLVLLAVAVVIALLSMRVRQYASCPDGKELIHKLRPPRITHDAAMIALSLMYSEIRETNTRANDERARLLSWSGVLLTLGFALCVAAKLVTKL